MRVKGTALRAANQRAPFAHVCGDVIAMAAGRATASEAGCWVSLSMWFEGVSCPYRALC